MKVFALISVMVVLASAEPPVYRQQNQQQRRYYFARQEEQTTTYAPVAAPYPPSGWKPDGPAFELPQKQVDDSYGPPKAPAGPAASVQREYGAPGAIPLDQAASQEQRNFANTQFQSRQQPRQFPAYQNQYQQRQYQAPVVQPPTNQYGPPEPQEQFQPPRPDQEYGAPVTTTEEPATTTEFEDATTTAAPQTDSEVEPVDSVNELDEEGDLDEQQAEQQRQRGEYYVALPDGRLQRIRYVSHQDEEAMKYFARIRAENVEPLRGPIYSYSPLQKLQFAPANLRFAPAVPAATSSVKSSKLELQEEEAAAPSPPLAAVAQYPYGAPSPVIPLAGTSSYVQAANYRVPAATETRYFITF